MYPIALIARSSEMLFSNRIALFIDGANLHATAKALEMKAVVVMV
jgi:hypothetical protein